MFDRSADGSCQGEPSLPIPVTGTYVAWAPEERLMLEQANNELGWSEEYPIAYVTT